MDMTVAAGIARVVLVIAFAVAAVLKLVDRSGFRRAVVDFGAPARLAAPLAWIVPALELAVAVLLVPGATARWAAAGALALLIVFTAAIAVALARGRRPECHCFGSRGSDGVGRGTLARNAGLIALGAVAVAVAPGAERSLPAAFDGVSAEAAMAAGLVVLGALLVATAWLCRLLLLQNGRLLLRLDDLERGGSAAARGSRAPGAPAPPAAPAVGHPAPSFAAYDLDGERVGLETLLAHGRPVALLFTDPDCAACAPLLPRVARLQAQRDGELLIAVVSRGGVARTRRERERHGLAHVLLQADDALPLSYGAAGVPSAVLLDAGGRIASAVAMGPDAVERLLAGAVPEASVLAGTVGS